MGVALIAFSKSTRLVLAKVGTSTVSSKTLFLESKSRSFSLSEIASVLLEKCETNDKATAGDGSASDQTRMTSTASLLTRAGRRVRAGNAMRTMNVGGLIGALIEPVPLRREADQIAAFTGVPMQSTESTGAGRFGV